MIEAVVGLAVASAAGFVSLRAGASVLAMAQTEVVGLAYLVAGAIAWRRRADDRTGLLLLAIEYSWYLPDFQAPGAFASWSVAECEKACCFAGPAVPAWQIS